MQELQESLTKRNTELSTARAQFTELRTKISDFEELLSRSQKDCTRLHEQNLKLQSDIKEVLVLIINWMVWNLMANKIFWYLIKDIEYTRSNE